MTVAVKYCGGCNPRYDRAALVARLREEYPILTFTGPADGCDLAIVICGCPSRCADHGNLSGKHGKLVLSSPGEEPLLRCALDALVRQGNAR